MNTESLVYLIRHPHTQVNESTPSERWGLSKRGEAQLEALLRHPLWASVRHTYTSSERKASIVGDRAFERHGIATSSHDNLGELRRPWLDGESYRRAVRQAFLRPDLAQPGWEAVRSGFNRVKLFLREIVASGPLPAAVVSHGLVLSALRADMLGQRRVDFEQWQGLPFAAAAVADLSSWKILSDFTAVEAL